MSRYFFRLDDIAPNMDWDNFNHLISIFKRCDIKPLLAVIPDNKDPELLKYQYSSEFWRIIKELNQNGWTIAQHGFEHLYKTGNGGVLKINKKGEFAGVEFNDQKTMIAEGGREVEAQIGIAPKIFVAPGHSFDKNTIRALKESGFNCISDGIALYPFKKWGLVWLPQILWRPRKFPFGLITIALHPNTMTKGELNNFEKFIKENRGLIGNFEELMGWYPRVNIFKKLSVFLINQPFKIFWYLAFRIKHELSR